MQGSWVVGATSGWANKPEDQIRDHW